MKTVITALLFTFCTGVACAGTWGDGSFENDEAMDWVLDCAKAKNISLVSVTLERIVDSKYIEAPYASEAIAAAEVVAAAMGRPSPKLPRSLQSWVSQQPRDALSALAPLALAALKKIRDPKVSELPQLWVEGKPNRWAIGLTELESRLAR